MLCLLKLARNLSKAQRYYPICWWCVQSDISLLDQLVESAKEFVADVVHDDWLQRESGDALWSSAQHALVPGLLRCVVAIS